MRKLQFSQLAAERIRGWFTPEPAYIVSATLSGGREVLDLRMTQGSVKTERLYAHRGESR